MTLFDVSTIDGEEVKNIMSFDIPNAIAQTDVDLMKDHAIVNIR
jgi:hypothetical protein